MQRLKILPVESKLFSVAFFWYCLQQLLGKIRIFLVVFFYSANILRKRANKMAPKRAANPEAVSLTTTVILTLLHRSSWQHSYQQEVKVPLLLYISQFERRTSWPQRNLLVHFLNSKTSEDEPCPAEVVFEVKHLS